MKIVTNDITNLYFAILFWGILIISLIGISVL